MTKNGVVKWVDHFILPSAKLNKRPPKTPFILAIHSTSIMSPYILRQHECPYIWAYMLLHNICIIGIHIHSTSIVTSIDVFYGNMYVHIFTSIHLSIYLSVYLSISLSTYLFLYKVVECVH